MMLLHVIVLCLSFICCVYHVIKKINMQATMQNYSSYTIVAEAKRQVIVHRDSMVVYLLICLYSWVNLVLELLKLA